MKVNTQSALLRSSAISGRPSIRSSIRKVQRSLRTSRLFAKMKNERRATQSDFSQREALLPCKQPNEGRGEQQGCQGNRGLIHIHTSTPHHHRALARLLSHCPSPVLNFTDPRGLARTASLIRTNGRELRWPERHFIGVKGAAAEAGDAANTGDPLF